MHKIPEGAKVPCSDCNFSANEISYTCSHCDFDLHVHCAYSLSDSTNAHQPNPVTSAHPDYMSYPNLDIGQQHFHGQSSSMVPNIAQVSTPFPTPNQAPTVHAQNSITLCSRVIKGVKTKEKK
ncbi:hypothetical protein Tco_0437029 [Tanacetum coccineum]